MKRLVKTFLSSALVLSLITVPVLATESTVDSQQGYDLTQEQLQTMTDEEIADYYRISDDFNRNATVHGKISDGILYTSTTTGDAYASTVTNGVYPVLDTASVQCTAKSTQSGSKTTPIANGTKVSSVTTSKLTHIDFTDTNKYAEAHHTATAGGIPDNFWTYDTY